MLLHVEIARESETGIVEWAKQPIGYTYRLDGLLKTKSLPGGTETATLAYDAAKRPISVSFSVAGAGAISQTYDRAGNVATEGRNLANAAAINGDAKTGTLTLRYRTPGGGPGGVLDTDGHIISFWYR